MKIGVTGATGRLGRVLINSFDNTRVYKLKNANDFDVVIHTAAYTDVDGAEDNIPNCLISNVLLTESFRKQTTAKIIYLSTDFIFDGLDGPYVEGDDPNPKSIYGLSKELGERILYNTDLIVRTTVLYDSHKPDFVTWILGQLKYKGSVAVSKEMITSPTNVYHLAEALVWLAENPIEQQIINVACMNPLSRFKFAQLVALFADYDIAQVIPTEQIVFGDAERPIRAGLITDLAQSLGVPIYSVIDGIESMSEENELWKSLL